MRTTEFGAGVGGAGGRPQASPRVRPASLVLIAAILLAFGLGTAASAAYEAFEDMQGRGEMDPTW
jgi:sulfite exporter TauE/SafE